MWLKIKQEGLRRFWSMCSLTRVPFWYRVFEPQPTSEKTAMAIARFFRFRPHSSGSQLGSGDCMSERIYVLWLGGLA